MKALYLLLIAALFLFLPPAAVMGQLDFGVQTENRTAFTPGFGPVLLQQNLISPWFTAKVGEYLTFTVQGNYTFSYRLGDGSMEHLLDLDLLRVFGRFRFHNTVLPRLEFITGRFLFQDPTEYILHQPLDGVEIIFPFAPVTFRAAGGYNGLLFSHFSPMLLNQADYQHAANPNRLLAVSRVVEYFEAAFPRLWRQNLTLFYIGQQDLPYLSTPSTGGVLHTQHAGAQLGGELLPLLTYTIHGTLGIGNTYLYPGGRGTFVPILSFLSGGRLTLTIDDYLSSVFTLRGFYSSGDTYSTRSGYLDGSNAAAGIPFTKLFPVLSKHSLGTIFTVYPGNIIYGEFDYAFRILQDSHSRFLAGIQSFLRTKLFFRSMNGPISDPSANTNSTSYYLGTEFSTGLTMRPTSDLGVNIAITTFFPDVTEGGVFENRKEPYYFQSDLFLSFSF